VRVVKVNSAVSGLPSTKPALVSQQGVRIRSRQNYHTQLYGLAFDEKQLQALVEKIQGFTTELGDDGHGLEVSIYSGTETFEIKGSNLEFLKSPNLPHIIDSVSIWFYGSQPGRFYFSIRLGHDSASLSVESDSEETLRAGVLFNQFKDQLKLRAYEFSWFARLIKSLAACLVVAFVTFFLLDAVGLRNFNVITAIVMANAAISVFLPFQLQKAFPVVRFEGQFLDSSRLWRRIFSVTISLVVALFIGIVSTASYEHWNSRQTVQPPEASPTTLRLSPTTFERSVAEQQHHAPARKHRSHNTRSAGSLRSRLNQRNLR